MADDKMKHDDQQRNMGSKGEGQNYGQQTPGRTGQGGQQGGQHTGGQQGQQGGSRKLNEDDDDFDTGSGSSKMGNQNRGGQNR